MSLEIRNVLDSALEKEKSHGGKGFLEKVRAFVSGDFETPIAFIDYVVIPPGASIGFHMHGDDEEVYFIVEGGGIMRDENSEVSVRKGDIIVNSRHGSHGLANNTNGNIVLLVFEVANDRTDA